MSWFGRWHGNWFGNWFGGLGRWATSNALGNIRAALETALYDAAPTFATAWENAAFAPIAGTPYQRVHVLFARPDNLIFGRAWRELGFMQVKLMYPLGTGSAAIAAKVNALCAVFYRGASFINNNITVVIHNSPSVSAGRVEGDRYAVPIKIRFFANNLS